MYLIYIIIFFLEQNDPNPETNSKLRSVIEMAQKNSMPKDTILNTIKKHVRK